MVNVDPRKSPTGGVQPQPAQKPAAAVPSKAGVVKAKVMGKAVLPTSPTSAGSGGRPASINGRVSVHSPTNAKPVAQSAAAAVPAAAPAPTPAAEDAAESELRKEIHDLFKSIYSDKDVQSQTKKSLSSIWGKIGFESEDYMDLMRATHDVEEPAEEDLWNTGYNVRGEKDLNRKDLSSKQVLESVNTGLRLIEKAFKGKNMPADVRANVNLLTQKIKKLQALEQTKVTVKKEDPKINNAMLRQKIANFLATVAQKVNFDQVGKVGNKELDEIFKAIPKEDLAEFDRLRKDANIDAKGAERMAAIFDKFLNLPTQNSTIRKEHDELVKALSVLEKEIINYKRDHTSSIGRNILSPKSDDHKKIEK